MKIYDIITLVTFLCLLFFLSPNTKATTTSALRSVTPGTVYVGKVKDIVIKFDNLPPESQFSLSPGGPYIKSSLAINHINDMAIMGNFAYVVTGNNMISSIDLGNPNNTDFHTLLTIEDRLKKLVITGHTAIVAGQNAIYMIDLADPLKAKIAGHLKIADTILDIYINLSHAFLLTNKNTLLVVDITDAASPTLARPYALDKFTQGLAGDNQHLFLAQAGHGVSVLDINDINNIKISGHYQTTGPALDIKIDNNIAYIASGKAGLTLLDITDPGHIRWLGSHQKLGEVHKVAIPGDASSDKHVLVINNENRIYLIDISKPAMPSIHSSIGVSSPVNNIHLSGTLVYASSDHELLTLDFSATPPQISNEGLDYGQGVNLGGQRRAFLRNDIAYVADWFSGIHIYDISTPQIPRLLSSFHTPGSPKGIVVEGDFAYVADDDHGLQILNINDPEHPTIISNILTPGLAYHPVLDGNKLYLASHRGGFQIIDITDVSNPEIIGQYDTPGMAWAIQVKDNMAYVADDDSGLLVFDISQPDSPTMIAQFQPGGAAEDILIKDNIAYVAFFDNGITILDISSPANPEIIGHIDTPGNARGLDLFENNLLVSDWLAGIHIIDIKDPANPVIIASYDTDGAAWGARIKNAYVYTMDWWGGFTVLDITNPKHIRLAGQYPQKQAVQQIITRDKFAFIANGKAGLQVFDINNPLNPTWVTGIDMDKPVITMAIDNQRIYIGQSNNIAIVDITNPFSASHVQSLPVMHASDILYSEKGRLYIAERGKGISIVASDHPEQSSIKQFLNIPVNDFCVDNNKLYVATNDGLFVYEISDTGTASLLKHYKTNHSAQIVRTYNNYIYVYQKNLGITIFNGQGDILSAIADIPFMDVQDMQAEGNELYFINRSNELIALDISLPDEWQILSSYKLQNDAARLHIHDGIIYVSGNKSIIAIKPLPRALFKNTANSTLLLNLPEDYPVGSYDVIVTNNKEAPIRFHNIFRVEIPPFSKPKFSMDDLRKVMESKNLITPTDNIMPQ